MSNMLLVFLLVLLLLPAFKGLSSIVFSHSTYVNSLSSQNSASVVYNSACTVSNDFCHLKFFPVMSQTNGKALVAYKTSMYPTLVQSTAYEHLSLQPIFWSLVGLFVNSTTMTPNMDLFNTMVHHCPLTIL